LIGDTRQDRTTVGLAN